MNRLFDNFFNGDDFNFLPTIGLESGLSTFTPRIDLTESTDSLKLTADLPGLEVKDIELSYSNGQLTLRGERSTEAEETKDNVHRVERTWGRFERTMLLPCEVDMAKIDAQFKNGVLTVTMPKTAESKKAQKKIAIKT
ncbi:MAG: Hsp20/alpha crystallin family protein [Planctomycetota bacterium]